ncbi:MAG: hypothetical protein E3J91_01785 [Hadesarchaea archaeon]|nr:MAG: hypothetical protein E3J91_01785 [Hadesarchaea archaeon]
MGDGGRLNYDDEQKIDLRALAVAVVELAKVVAGEADLPYVPHENRAVEETTNRLIRALTGRRV